MNQHHNVYFTMESVSPLQLSTAQHQAWRSVARAGLMVARQLRCATNQTGFVCLMTLAAISMTIPAPLTNRWVETIICGLDVDLHTYFSFLLKFEKSNSYSIRTYRIASDSLGMSCSIFKEVACTVACSIVAKVPRGYLC